MTAQRPTPGFLTNMTDADRELSGCTGKARFPTPAMARMAAKKKPGRVHYRCKFCGAWHMGTKRNGD